MKVILRKYLFVKWWLPIILFVLASIIYILSLANTHKIINQIIDCTLLTSIVLLVSATIWQIVKSNTTKYIIQGSVLVLGFIVLSFVSSFMMMFGPDTDTFADDLKLPTGIEKEYPKQLTSYTTDRIDEARLGNKPNRTFQLYNSYQPGLFEYDCWLNSRHNGIIYLKAFEVTKNIELSKSTLREQSSVKIEITDDKVKRFGTDDTFTIYEGDWQKPYLARFEIWCDPNNEGDEFKILEKNYVIEGWMR